MTTTTTTTTTRTTVTSTPRRRAVSQSASLRRWSPAADDPRTTSDTPPAFVGRRLHGTRLSFGSGTAAAAAAFNPFAIIQRTARTDSQSSQTPTPPIRLAERPFAFLAAPTTSPSTTTQRPVADRRTAGRRSSIIASLRPHRPSIDRRSKVGRTARQRQQRSQLFQCGRPQVDGGDGGSSSSSDASDEVFGQSVAAVVVPTIDASTAAAAAATIARFERESGVSIAGGDFEHSLHNALTFEQLLQRMPSVQPFEADCSTSSTVRPYGGSASSETDADRSLLLRSLSGEEDADAVPVLPFNASSRSSDGALMVHQYLDRTRSIESLSRAQAGSFRLGRIPRRRSVQLPVAASGGESADASMVAVLSSSASSSWSGWTGTGPRRRRSAEGGASEAATTVATEAAGETVEQQQAKVKATVGVSVAAVALAFVMLYVTQAQQMMQ